ncbi:MAG: hypothetical protein LIO91_11745 [Bacteroidales bacterium]|nr:hypothetical protein [Bacteroidales bacterium]
MDDYSLDYDIPYDGMSNEEFLYRAMNPEDPMYMGSEDAYEDIDPDDFDDWD